MRQSFKNTFQPLEIALKKAFGIRKERKGQIFDSRGIVCDSKEKITRFVFFIPLFHKIRVLVNVSEFSNGAIATNTSTGGGESQNFNATKSTLYTIKTRYKIFGIQVFFKTTTQIHKTQSLSIWANPYIGKYITTSPNIEQEILALISGLSKENQAFVLRQMGRCAQSYRDNNHSFTVLSQSEIDEWRRIESEFLPNIFQLGENLYCYKHYLLPVDRFEISVF